MFFRVRSFKFFPGWFFFFFAFGFSILIGRSYAGIPVIDPSNLVQNIISAIENVYAVSNQVEQLTNQGKQLQYKLKSLKTLDPAMYSQLTSLLSSNVNDLQTVLSNVQGIGYSLGNVQDQYDAIFPQGTDWENVKVSDYEDYYRRWNDEVANSTQTAMQTQSVLARVGTNYDRASDILIQSKTADGEVRQLQAANEMLSVVLSQLGDLTQATVAGSRALSTVEAVSAAGKRAAARLGDLVMEDYTTSTTTGSIYSDLPGLQ